MLEVPLSLYVHIPWCVKKCPYCDFNSHELRSPLPEDQYIDALIADLQQQANIVSGREIVSIFFGGGTPSLFSAKNIQRLLISIEAHLSLASDAEITIEANPGTFDQQNFAGFRNAGVNRISIGVQSFSNDQLKELGRIHDAQTAIDAITAAKSAGFENINIDLMYALPKQTTQQAADDVEQAIKLDPTHISYYQLTIEPNTRFYQHPPNLPNSESSWDMQQQGVALLAQHGFQQYEVSAYAKNEFTCIHNTNYWQFGDYLGIGAGAHQKLSHVTSGEILRSDKPKHPQQYMQQALKQEPLATPRVLQQDDLVFEFLLNALRLKQGFNRQQFEQRTGLMYELLTTQLQHLCDEGLLLVENDRVQCSEKGYRFLDELLQRVLPESA